VRRTKGAVEAVIEVLERGRERQMKCDHSPASWYYGLVDAESECAHQLRVDSRGLAASDCRTLTQVDPGCCVADILQ
jgi:hypothetical protein